MAMATDDPRQESDCDDTKPKDDCAECDTSLIDELKCKAAGVAAEAAYNAEYQDDVTAAQADFIKIRNEYRKARTGVKLDVQQMRHQICVLIDKIKCMIKQERVVDCLDAAWHDVYHDLKCCWSGGCCVSDDECQFPTPEDCPDETELKKLIAEYAEKAAHAQDCWKKLSGEPAALTQRVRDRQAELDAIQTAVYQGDPATTDLKRLYASALVLRYRLKIVWDGFEEIKDFVDCLCRALTCWTEGSAAIAILNGRLAVLECKQKAKKDRCDALWTNPVDEVLTVYERKCCEDPCPDPDDNHDHDCGCGCHDEKKPEQSS